MILSFEISFFLGAKAAKRSIIKRLYLKESSRTSLMSPYLNSPNQLVRRGIPAKNGTKADFKELVRMIALLAVTLWLDRVRINIPIPTQDDAL